MNHRLNAKLHKLPHCPECNAFEALPCTDQRGNVRTPHRSRELVASGALIVIRVEDARRTRRLRQARTLAAAINRRST